MDRTSHKGGLDRLPLSAGIFVALVCGIILALSTWNEWDSRNNQLREAEIDLNNLTRSLLQHAEGTVDLADAALTGVVSALEIDGLTPASLARLQTVLMVRKANMRRLSGIFVYDENGRWLASTENVDLAGYNNADRDYFVRHRLSPDRAILIGRPVQSKSGGQWVITMSRRWNHPDGSFGGVAAVTVDTAYFESFYRQFDVGPRGTITLMTGDGVVLAHGSIIGRDAKQRPWVNDIPYHPRSGVLHLQLPEETFERIGYYQRDQRYPLLVMATLTQADLLAQWEKASYFRIAVVVCLVMLIFAIGVFLVRQLSRGQRMAMALASQEQSFRLLAEGSSDIVARIGLDGRVRYVSPSTFRVLGWTPEQVVGQSSLIGVNPQDIPQLERSIRAVRRGEIEEARATYRVRRADKVEIWAESTLRAARRENGDIDGFVAITRDVTEQMIRQGNLTTLAIVDGLTGLANRRRFDERLYAEWARACRDNKPLGLLMIDIDHFKKFNDAYGHPAGDACLHAIADVLINTRRSTDLAARYGGEEFAMLLPGTDAAGTARAGERIRSALHQVALTHRLNLPSGLVTASIGGAVCNPADERPVEPLELLEAADRALYAAKNGGRDCVVMADELITLVPAEPQPDGSDVAAPPATKQASETKIESRTG